jgi:N-acyl-D-aspartate/D-glutamate deacylase
VRGNLLVRGGTLVDGTGASPRAADVRIRDGAVAEVAPGLAPDGETVVDADGAYVAPGFIDCHTHYDPSVWWDPLVDPMPQHGVTTVVTGNCSLSLTPVRAAGGRPATCSASSRTSRSTRLRPGSRGTGSRMPSGGRPAGARHRNVARSRPFEPARLRDATRRGPARPEGASDGAVLADSLAVGALGLSTSFID